MHDLCEDASIRDLWEAMNGKSLIEEIASSANKFNSRTRNLAIDLLLDFDPETIN